MSQLDTPATILVVDGDPQSADELARVLEEAGYRVGIGDPDPRSLLRDAASGEWNLILVDSGNLAAGLLEDLGRLSRPPAVIVLARFGTVSEAVQAMQEGAFDFVVRPFSDEQVLLAVRRAISQHSLAKENDRLRASLGERFSLDNLIGRDPKLEGVYRMVESVADTRASILITGESGTGKTLLARSIHTASSRKDGPFVVVNCGALPPSLLESELFGHVRGAFTGAVRDRPGKFEQADGGSIFLDEIATASPDLQVKLLRVIQDRTLERVGDSRTLEVDVRLIAATNSDLTEEVAEGRFREDLYYRIHVITLEVPALRERLGDVPLLAEHFLRRFIEEHERAETAIEPEAMARLMAFHWPGNVRQLENTIERALLLSQGGRIRPRDLGPELQRVPEPRAPLANDDGTVLPLKQALEGPERRLIVRALELNDGNRQRTAAMLGVNRTTLFNKMRKYGLLDRPASRSAAE